MLSIEKSSTPVFVYSAALAGVLAFGFAGTARAQRDVVSLDGDWQIEDSLSANQLPSAWRHTVQVPGMANLARPGFPDVDQYLTRGNILDQVYFGLIPKGAPVPEPGPKQNRNYFWYQKTFRAPRPRQVALLRINKAQFGTAVWLNGKKIGEHAGCFTAGYFDLTPALDWSGENRLVVRIGAHPGVLPENFPSGTDFEKVRWTPGIYDSVSVLLADNPVIQPVQVAPRINPPEILVQVKLKNYGIAPARCQLEQRVESWREARPVNRAKPRRITLAPGETKIMTETLAVPSPRLWTPETPYLYLLRSSTGGDSVSTRFGMRELRFDTATGRAWLNGRIYFLRGSNITLHRFFEDPAAGALPWTEAWVRKLLVDIPKRMNWNSFRFCIGPVPDRWLDIADEAGLLIQNEFFMWTGDAPV